jgi:hypothetical protein
MGGCVLVDKVGTSLNQLKVYLEKFWEYYNSSAGLQKELAKA